MHENEITGVVVDSSMCIHKRLGPGLLESVYEEVLAYELTRRRLQVERQVGLPVIYEEVKMEMGFRAALVIERKVIVEIKSVEALARVHFKQLLTYLRLSEMKVGLLINFNEDLLKSGIKRVVNNL